MTNQQHPIIPPPELIEDWIEIAKPAPWRSLPNPNVLCTLAAQWGADQELEACIEWLGDAPVVYNDNGDLHPGSYLRDARRPRPPSLKEQALARLAELESDEPGYWAGIADIRRALEQLDD